MGRISQTFERLRRARERALIPYIMAGDPDMPTSKALVCEMVRRGGDLVEVGVPFSDPLADGPIIQRAGQRALQAGTTVRQVLRLVAELRAEVDAPLVLMSYYNPIFRYGEAAFVADAVAAGVDGLIIPDLPPEEAHSLLSLTAETPLDVIFLVAPTSTAQRMAMIAELSRGFIYYVSRLGTTGVRDRLADDLAARLRQLRAATAKPIAVGFGVSTPEHVQQAAEAADGVVVASAILKLIEDLPDRSRALARVGDFVAALKAATRVPPIAARPAPS
jgi:tryptophan synthase alpha chain